MRLTVLLKIRFGHAQINNPKIGIVENTPNVENTPCQPPACFLVQNFVYSIESLGEIIFHIFKLKKVTLCVWGENNIG